MVDKTFEIIRKNSRLIIAASLLQSAEYELLVNDPVAAEKLLEEEPSEGAQDWNMYVALLYAANAMRSSEGVASRPGYSGHLDPMYRASLVMDWMGLRDLLALIQSEGRGDYLGVRFEGTLLGTMMGIQVRDCHREVVDARTRAFDFISTHFRPLPHR